MHMFNRLGLFLILLIPFMANCAITPSLSQAADFLGEENSGEGQVGGNLIVAPHFGPFDNIIGSINSGTNSRANSNSVRNHGSGAGACNVTGGIYGSKNTGEG